MPEPGNPQALNRYSYVLNNPVKFVDSSGHFAFIPILLGVAIIGLISYDYLAHPDIAYAPALDVDVSSLPPSDLPDNDAALCGPCPYVQERQWAMAAVMGAVELTPLDELPGVNKVIREGAEGVAEQGLKGVARIDPWKVRFSQDSISYGFKDKALGTIDDLAEGLLSGRINPSDVPAIRITEVEGKLFTLDNRRLEAFRRAGIDIPYRWATPEELAREGWKFTTTNEGITIIVKGQP